ncbi:hypothetical protein [Isoalcanivorax beigongshangi]|uniref:Uncharacterized protein n=1 Tax=Isoalcanivorax beigongshangi TaxID=3238810 RepID=A0ABV4AGK5_9GAMM
MTDQFYLQDSRDYVGNCVVWWRRGGGYTTRLDEAEKFSRDKAMGQHRCRETDIPWPCSEVEPLVRPTVDVQFMRPIREQVAKLSAEKETSHD